MKLDVTAYLKLQFAKIEWLIPSFKGDFQAKYVRIILDYQLRKHKDMLERMIKDFGWDVVSDDVRMILMLRWVKNNIDYKSDKLLYKKAEYWADISETLEHGAGDCEDGAMLLYLLGRASGIPADRLWLTAGDVQGGGHAWVRYISLSFPYVSFYLDWCYFYDAGFILDRKPYSDYDGKILGDDRYKTVWFMSNDEVTLKWQKRKS